MNILVINAGSSSREVSAAEPETGALLAKGLCERIGIDGKFTYKPQMEGKQVLDAIDIAMPTHSEAIQAVLDALVDKDNGVIGSMKEIDAVGHRVVHGGEAFNQSVLITDEVMKALEDCIPLAPLHNPANITGINACTAVMGKDVPPGRRVRHCFPSDYARQRPTCMPCPMSTMRRTRSAATASTALPTSMSPAAPLPCWARSPRSSS